MSQRRKDRKRTGHCQHKHVGQHQVALSVHQIGQGSGRKRQQKHRQLRGRLDQADHDRAWRKVRHDPAAGGVLDPGPQGIHNIGHPQPAKRAACERRPGGTRRRKLKPLCGLLVGTRRRKLEPLWGLPVALRRHLVVLPRQPPQERSD